MGKGQILNRSEYTVSVARRPDLERAFAPSRLKAAIAYRDQLRRQGLAPRISQGDDHLYVRIRQKGFDDVVFPAQSYEEAQASIDRIASERAQGLFIDYRTGHKVTIAELMERYILEECPKHKGCRTERYTLSGWIADSKGELAAALAERQRALAAGEKAPTIRATREPRRGLKWLHRPFAQVRPTDVEQYIHDRIDQEIAPSTVDRELDLLSQVVNWAIVTLRIDVHRSPMQGVRRPRYFNERDRRLTDDEEARLLAAAREEDRVKAREAAIEAAIAPSKASTRALKASESTRKRRIAEARAVAERSLPATADAPPVYEALITFLMGTACRRSETHRLTWGDTYLTEATALFPLTKNGRARRVPLRDAVVDLLARLPKNGDRVFPVAPDELDGAWTRICERAGLVDFHLHDLRHHGCTKICEAFRAAGMPLNVTDLAAITGHRDLRMLARYTNLCTGELAERMNEAFAAARAKKMTKKGRIRPSGSHPASPRKLARPTSGNAAAAIDAEIAEADTDATLASTEDFGGTYNRLPI